MKKLLLAILVLSTFHFSYADFDISASAICMNVNGASSFYNTNGSNVFSKMNFTGSLGVFGRNSGNLKIIGAAINTNKSSSANVCGGSLFYIVYPQGSRPASPVFTSINLSLNSSIGNIEKWQNVDNAVDLTSYTNGNYTLEIYYVASGSNTLSSSCSQQKMDNDSGANYTTSFTITSPLALNFSSLYAIANDNSIQVKWKTENDADIVTYEVQRSDNGLNFSTIGTISSKQSSTTSSYYFNDNNPLTSTNYYRLKTDNNNNTSNLSNVIRIYFDAVANTILIYPNPTGNILTIHLAGIGKSTYQLSVLNSAGQFITTMPYIHDGIDKTMNITLPIAIPKGIYWLFLIDKELFYKQAFMIK